MQPTVLHVIQCLSRGGATRSLIAAARATAQFGIGHRVVSLEVPADGSIELAGRAGLAVIARPDVEMLQAELAHADIVHAHFWNTPELYALLSGPLPPMRLLLYCEVAGDHPPQALTRELVEFADLTVVASPYTAELPCFRDAPETEVIPAVSAWEHMRGFQPRPHTSFNVGYIGTVDFAKMHPRMAALCAAVDVPDARFIVCGSGDAFKSLSHQASALGVRDRFDLRGFVEDVKSVFEQLDVFGYPLCPENYSAAELVLQEAMYCGIPPVVLPYRGASRLVDHGRTGLIAEDENAYIRAIEWLHSHPRERRRLGRAAADHARRTWRLEEVAAQWLAAYERLAAEPKRARTWIVRPGPGVTRARGAALFVQSLGDKASEFATSLTVSDPDEVAAAEETIAAATPGLASADAGGVLHWRRRHPRDPWLRLWAGLVLYGQRRRALAAAEFNGAIRLGLDEPRVRRYLERCLRTGEAVRS